MIAQIDANSDGKISREEFTNFIVEQQKKQLLEVEGQLEDIRKMFREVAMADADPLNDDALTTMVQNGSQLSRKGLRKLLEKIGVQNITNEDIDRIFAEIDGNKNNKIDIDEFMKYMYGTDAKE